jgi:hypothetical protein
MAAVGCGVSYAPAKETGLITRITWGRVFRQLMAVPRPTKRVFQRLLWGKQTHKINFSGEANNNRLSTVINNSSVPCIASTLLET